MVPADLTKPSYHRIRRAKYSPAQISDSDLGRFLGIQHSGEFSPPEITTVVRLTVQNFCSSGDDDVDVKHIPLKWAPLLDATTRRVVLHHATELWKETVSPTSRDLEVPLRDFHRVKWAALHRLQIPARYTHVLIDECHDLAKPMLQILDDSPQAVISLGDEYQNLRGTSQERSNVIRQRAVTHAIRSGVLIEPVVNPIIMCTRVGPSNRSVATRLAKQEIAYYENPRIPEQPTAILVNDHWGLFEWSQRLAQAGVEFELLRSPKDLTMFVNDCIELHRQGTRPRHRELVQFASWAAVEIATTIIPASTA